MDEKKWYDGYIQVRTPNKKSISSIVLEEKGVTRSAAQYANDVGLTTSRISRLINGNYTNPIELEILVKLAENNDDVLRRLLRANGMISSEQQEKRQNSHLSRLSEMSDLKISLENIIVSEIFSRGVTLKKIMRKSMFDIDLDYVLNGFSYDFGYELQTDFQTLKWYFECFGAKSDDSDEKDIARVLRRFIYNHGDLFLNDSWDPESLAESKVSFVFIDECFMERFIEIMTKAKLKNIFSALLVDVNQQKVKREVILNKTYEQLSLFETKRLDFVDEFESESPFFEDGEEDDDL